MASCERLTGASSERSMSSNGLTREGCLIRQRRLQDRLRRAGLDAALLFDARHVHYFTGHHDRAVFQSLLFLPADGAVVLALPYDPPSPPVCDRVVVFPAMEFGTLVDDQPSAALDAIPPELFSGRTLGCDEPRRAVLASRCELRDINAMLLALRRRKDPDEVTLIRRAVAACEAAYARARQILRPGISEIEVYAEVQAAAVRAAGEPIGEFGNDFQSGTPGGPPRARALVAGELMPLDLAVSIRGYRGDLCRTFAVGVEPTPAQRDAHARVLQALAHFERAARPGTTCRAIDEEIRKSLDGYRGWRFPHHLGHGTGLSPHEAPRLNPRSDDSLEVGDVLAVEPGLYGPELNAGVRVEQDYLVTPDGVEPLSSFSTDL
jgi:Xaa-Pro dipeptidase